MIGVILPGGNGAHDLPHHGDGGEAGVVVDKFEPRVNGCPVVIIQDFHVVSMAPEHRLQEGEMDGGHLGRQNGPALLLHLPGVYGPAVGDRLGMGNHALAGPHVHSGEQAPDPNSGRAQVGHLVNFEDGVQLAAGLQNLRHLVCGYRVQTAAKGIELDELQVLPGPDKLRRSVEPGVVNPLVIGPKGPPRGEIHGNGILGEDRQAIGGDELGDAVVDLRVYVIGAACQDDAPAAVLLHPLEGLPALGPHVLLRPALLVPGGVDSPAGFCTGDAPGFPAQPLQPGGGGAFVGHGDEGTYVVDAALCDGVYIVF